MANSHAKFREIKQFNIQHSQIFYSVDMRVIPVFHFVIYLHIDIIKKNRNVKTLITTGVMKLLFISEFSATSCTVHTVETYVD